MKKVFVGISGGVDSSVSAYLLKKQGYDVTGVFIKVWYPEFISCDWRKEMHDAMRVCAKLEIPFLLCDLENEYKTGVIDYMIEEYKTGRTPNPDVMCNKEVKFKAFLKFAMENGADYVATGHYAQNSVFDRNSKKSQNEFALVQSVDRNKDQTYFLWNLNQDILKKVLFPIGHLEKEEVRKIAKKAGLLTAAKKDSQGLCFIGHVDMKDFLRHYIKTEKGGVLDVSGKVIGAHDGAILYTIGERHGFEVFEKTATDKPLYIISKDLNKNTITVSETKIEDKKSIVKLEKVNWIRVEKNIGDIFDVKTRYRQNNQKVKVVEKTSTNLTIEFFDNKEPITPGQSIVFYLESECLGGGVIC